jgi:8-oxo-dGTP pyrophosphatase MutT (NUDIX family)
MATTAVVAENLVAGLQALAWIALLVLAIFGTDWLDPNAASDWAALVTLVVIAAAYMFGVMIDRFADDLVLFLERRRPPKPVDKPADIVRMRMAMLAKGDGVARFLDYQRSRVRIARATVLNFLLVVPAVVWFLLARSDASTVAVLVAAIVGLVGAGLAFSVYRAIDFAYVSRLSDVYRAANGIPDASIAAAVCYCRREGPVQFRLVRTADGERWTFPKGHQQDGETLPEAAAREAEEEAGVEGSIDGKRLITYRYPSSRRDEVEDDLVAAFLLKVKKVRMPTEGHRAQAWCDVDAAREKLGEGRDLVHAQEMEKVLHASARELERFGIEFVQHPVSS